MIIAPSILSANFANLEEDMKMLETSNAQYVHIDIMDGLFVPNISFGPMVVAQLRPCTTKFFDVHLMIQHPTPYIDEFVKAGADGITVHVESYETLEQCLKDVKYIKELGKKVGITLKPNTPLSAIEPLLPIVDLVLVMTVEPGFGGQSFIDSMVLKLEELTQRKRTHNETYQIQIDGGVNDRIVTMLEENEKIEVDIYVAGSYIFGDHPHQKIDGLLQLKK